MVIIQERIADKGNLEYTIKDYASGAVHTWLPPSGIPREKHEAFLLQIVEMLDTSNPQEQSRCLAPISLQEAGEMFLSRKEADLAEYTRYSWSNCLKTRVYPALGKMPVSCIKPKHILDLYHSMREEGLCTSTLRKYHMVLMRLFQFLEEYEYVDENIMNRVKRPKPQKEEVYKEIEAFTPEQVSSILQSSENIPLRCRAMIWLLVDTGIRRGECVALRWEDINFHTCTINVSRSAGYTPEKGQYITTPKNRKSRTVSVDPEVMFLLLQIYRESKSQWVFDKRRDPDCCMHPQTPTRYFEKFSKKYGFEMNPHKLRHTFASISILNGADINSVAAILGHHDPAFTLRTYTHSNLTSQKKASEMCRQAIKTAMEQSL